jgi:DNA polymerase III subunit epsilon
MSEKKHWLDGPMIVFDTETTGIDIYEDRIVQAAIIIHEPPRPDDIRMMFYIDPGFEIPEAASKVNGLTRAVIQRNNPFEPKEGIAAISSYIEQHAIKLGYPIVMFNAIFDLPILNEERKRYGMQPISGASVLDPLVIDRRLDKYRKGGRKLTDLSVFYGVNHKHAHDAYGDARATLDLMHCMGTQFPDLRKQSLEDMQVFQKRWYGEWRDHINEYWKSKGSKERIDAEWPHYRARDTEISRREH